jgi:hypothetical protein
MDDAKQAWKDVGDSFAELGRRLKEHLDREGPSAAAEGEAAKDALRQTADAVGKTLEALGQAVRDPGVKEEAKRAARSLADAFGTTMEELGEQIRSRRGHDDPGPPPTTTP